MKLMYRFFVFIFILLSLSSCGEYQKIFRNDDYDAKFDYANRMFEKESYSKALPLYEQIYQRFPKTDRGEVAYYRMGKAYFAEKDYYMAGYYFSQFALRFPSSVNAEEAHFLSAMCAVRNSPSSSLDQEETELALNDLQLFVQRYPQSELIDSCNRTMDRLRFKIETKRYSAVVLYDKMEENRAAVASAKSFLEEYPRSTYLEEVVILEYENAYTLAMNSILDKKKERIEDAMNTHNKYVSILEKKEANKSKYRKYQSNLENELLFVDEQYDFIAINRAFNESNSSSKQKKIQFLEETITRFNNFAEKYPHSEFLEKAKSISKRAERELSNI